MNQPARPRPHSDEIDLIELFHVLWKSKIIIILITLAVSCMAAGYAFLSPPIYQTSVHTLPPSADGLTSYNLASQLTGDAVSHIGRHNNTPQRESVLGIEPLTPEDAYKTFLRHLNSGAVRLRFFEQYFQAPTKTDSRNEGQPRTLAQLNDVLTITLPTRASEVQASVTFEGTDPHTVADWANVYVALAMQAAHDELEKGLAGEMAIRQQSVESQITVARQTARQTRLNYITRLENALSIAKRLNLETPSRSTIVALNTQNPNTEGGLLYLRGAQTLRVEMQQLEQRQNDDPYIAELPNLLKQQALIKSVNLNLDNLSVASIDRQAIAPAQPVKPKKALVLLLGLILGGILGVFTVLMRHMLKR